MFQNGLLYRIDFAYNHIVSNDLNNYLKILLSRNYPYLKTIYHPGEGIEYWSKSHKLSFYNKEEEQGLPFQEGILRQEIMLRGGNLNRYMNKEYPTLGNIKIERCKEVLENGLQELGLNQTTYCDSEAYRPMLIDKYGSTKGTNIYHHWIDISSYPREELIKSGISPKTYVNWAKEVKEAELPKMSSELQYPLPPLTIDFEKNISLII